MVVQALRAPPVRVKRGKLWRPSGKVSTYIRQSVISIASNTTRRSKSVVHGIETSRRFAIRKGRDWGVSPSMITSSTTNRPSQRCTDSLPMCIGRPMYCDAAPSALALSDGPRSIDTVLTTATARITAHVTTTPRITRRVARARGWLRTV